MDYTILWRREITYDTVIVLEKQKNLSNIKYQSPRCSPKRVETSSHFLKNWWKKHADISAHNLCKSSHLGKQVTL